MRNLLAFLAASAIVLGGAGWYLDWFKFSTAPKGDGYQSVTIDVNTKKLGSDVSTAVKKGEEIIEKDKSAAPTTDGKGVEIKTDSKGVEIKTPNLDFSVPSKDFQFPQR